MARPLWTAPAPTAYVVLRTYSSVVSAVYLEQGRARPFFVATARQKARGHACDQDARVQRLFDDAGWRTYISLLCTRIAPRILLIADMLPIFMRATSLRRRAAVTATRPAGCRKVTYLLQGVTVLVFPARSD